MSCSILLNCKENVLDHLSFDVMYMNWLTSPNRTHIIKIISSSSHNYSGTLKKKKQILGTVTWFCFAHQYYSGNQGHVIGCNVDGAPGDCLRWYSSLQFLSVYLYFQGCWLYLSFAIFLVSHTKATYCCQCSVLSMRVKNLSSLKRSDCINLFLIIINRAFREERQLSQLGVGVGCRSRCDKEQGSWLLLFCLQDPIGVLILISPWDQWSGRKQRYRVVKVKITTSSLFWGGMLLFSFLEFCWILFFEYSLDILHSKIDSVLCKLQTEKVLYKSTLYSRYEKSEKNPLSTLVRNGGTLINGR